MDCRVAGYTDELQDIGLVGYSCTGDARPDLDGSVIEHVPSGLLCADEGPMEDSGDPTYCCTEQDVPCVYNPVADCREGESGYQCYSNNRPESLNPAIRCTNGTVERGLTHYCCTGQPEESPCQQSDAAGCGDRLKGFLCQGDQLPRGEDLEENMSRADYFYPVCSTAKPAPNPEYKTYCCYMPLPIPQGGTCVPDPDVPGCDPGRFGFACYGPDNPEDDYPPMDCLEPGFSGTSREGYDSTLFCCDFK